MRGASSRSATSSTWTPTGASAATSGTSGRCRVVGDQPSAAQIELIEANIAIVDAVCAAIRPGIRARDAHRAGAEVAAQLPIVQRLAEGPKETEGFPALGHGIGLGWEGPWITATDETILEPGMAIAVETLFGAEGLGGTFFEENGIVSETGLRRAQHGPEALVVTDAEAMRDLLERLRQAWETMDADAALACFADDTEIVVIGTDAPEYWSGHAALVEPFRAMTDAFSEASYQWSELGPSVEMLNDAAWAAGVLRASFKTADGWVDLPMRTSIVARLDRDGSWRIRHAHFSLAAADPVAY